jgi:predicted metalloprotease with PDZ domain
LHDARNKDGPADKVGLGPGMRPVAVNGRSFTPALLRAAVNDAAGAGAPAVELLVENSGYFKLLKVDCHGGERYPVLERVAGIPDSLDDIQQPLAKPSH